MVWKLIQLCLLKNTHLTKVNAFPPQQLNKQWAWETGNAHKGALTRKAIVLSYMDEKKAASNEIPF